MRTLGMRSFIRFNERRKVDLPQPEGPINVSYRILGDIYVYAL